MYIICPREGICKKLFIRVSNYATGMEKIISFKFSFWNPKMKLQI